MKVLISDDYIYIYMFIFSHFGVCRHSFQRGPVNIYGYTGPGYLQRDHWLFLPSGHTGPPIILIVEYTGLQVVSM